MSQQFDWSIIDDIITIDAEVAIPSTTQPTEFREMDIFAATKLGLDIGVFPSEKDLLDAYYRKLFRVLLDVKVTDEMEINGPPPRSLDMMKLNPFAELFFVNCVPSFIFDQLCEIIESGVIPNYEIYTVTNNYFRVIFGTNLGTKCHIECVLDIELLKNRDVDTCEPYHVKIRNPNKPDIVDFPRNVWIDLGCDKRKLTREEVAEFNEIKPTYVPNYMIAFNYGHGNPKIAYHKYVMPIMHELKKVVCVYRYTHQRAKTGFIRDYIRM